MKIDQEKWKRISNDTNQNCFKHFKGNDLSLVRNIRSEKVFDFNASKCKVFVKIK